MSGEQFVGPYQLTRELGRGAMGSVWLARLPGRPGALAAKVLHRSDAATIGRFRREAYIGQRLRHEHLVRILEAGDLEGERPWIVMEYLEGESLEQRLARTGPLACEEALGLLDQLLSGLSAVHEAQVVHRDLKPANLFLARTPTGERLKLVDFGVSRVLDEEEVARAELFVSMEGELSGTPQYVAPEALLEPAQVTPGHDVYACGVILYETLTGRLPYPRPKTLRDLLESVLEAAVPALDEACPARAPFPPALERIVRRLLEKDPALRPLDAPAARAFVNAVRAGRPEPGATSPPASRGRISGRIRRWLGGDE